MTARPMMLFVAGSLALAPLAFSDGRAVPRGGGGGSSQSGGGSSGSHPTVHSSGGGSSQSGSGGGSSSSSGSSYTPSSGERSRSTAERRHPRGGTGTGDRWYGDSRGRDYRRYGYRHYDRYYYTYPGWGWSSYWWPYGGWGWSTGYWGPGWGAGGVHHYVHRDTGSVRVLVDPSEARVYVDGYYTGTVDDFDGLFQRLNLSPGRHEIALKLEGYKTHRMKVYVSPYGTLKLHYDMVRGTGETSEDLIGDREARDLARARAEAGPEDEAEEDAPEADEPMAREEPGRLRLRIQPNDASIYVDGAFRGTAREAASLRLPPGRHRIEVVRPGFKTEERQVDVAPGEQAEVSIELEKPSI